MSVLKMFGYNAAAAQEPDQVYPLGLMHYKRKKPGAVSFRVIPMNPKWSQPWAEKGLENTKFLELNPEGYAAFVRAYIASAGDISAGFTLGFHFIANHAVGGDSAKAIEVYTRFPELEAGRLKRALDAEKREPNDSFALIAELVQHQDVFSQAMSALAKMGTLEHHQFLSDFLMYVSLERGSSQESALLGYLAKVLCTVFPTTANAASAAFAADSVDLADYKTVRHAYDMLVKMFTPKPSPEVIGLPADFAP